MMLPSRDTIKAAEGDFAQLAKSSLGLVKSQGRERPRAYTRSFDPPFPFATISAAPITALDLLQQQTAST
jgi:hypothetical protein